VTVISSTHAAPFASSQMVDVVQICYAERLGKIYVVGTNWFFFMMYRIVSPLLSAKTR